LEISVSKARVEEKPILRNLMELCQHDYSEFTGQEVSDQGLFNYGYLDHYWTDPGRHPFLIRVDGKLAGFVLVRELESHSEESPAHFIADFFVMRRHRRRGVGQFAAHRVFSMFPGRWRVSEEAHNTGGQIFWRKVISRYTEGHFREIQGDEVIGPVQEFVVPAK
jgi:predicted acetyltransferase